MRALRLLARASGAVLLAGGLLKGMDLPDTARSFTEYFGMGAAAARVMVGALCALEIGLGAWSLARPRAAAPWMVVVFAVFTGWHLGVRLLIGEGYCPCF